MARTKSGKVRAGRKRKMAALFSRILQKFKRISYLHKKGKEKVKKLKFTPKKVKWGTTGAVYFGFDGKISENCC